MYMSRLQMAETMAEGSTQSQESSAERCDHDKRRRILQGFRVYVFDLRFDVNFSVIVR